MRDNGYLEDCFRLFVQKILKISDDITDDELNTLRLLFFGGARAYAIALRIEDGDDDMTTLDDVMSRADAADSMDEEMRRFERDTYVGGHA